MGEASVELLRPSGISATGPAGPWKACSIRGSPPGSVWHEGRIEELVARLDPRRDEHP